MSLQGLNMLVKELSNDNNCQPIHNLEVGIHYQYLTAEEDMFAKNFSFKVLEDNDDHYLIDIADQYQTSLYKTFELVEAFNTGKLIRLGIL